MTLLDDLQALNVERGDDVAIAFAPTLPPRRASVAARRIAQRLDDAGVPADQRVWIVGAGASDERIARLTAAIVDAAGGSRLILHNAHDADALVFQRRIPGQRRGGVYLNHAWQSANVRIACGDPLTLVDGLSAWFNPAARLSADDLHAAFVLGG